MKYQIFVCCFLMLSLTLDVPLCTSSNIPILKFSYQNGTADDTTVARLCYDQKNLIVEWNNIDR